MFQKGSTKKATAPNQRPPEKARTEFEPVRIQLRAAAEPLRHLQAGQPQIYSIYSLALFKWQKKYLWVSILKNPEPLHNRNGIRVNPFD